MNYGYARVSTTEQNEDRQLIALREKGVDRIFLDKASGKDFDRPGWKRLKRAIKKGDVLFLPSLDRMGRNWQALMDEWAFITRKKGAHIVVMDMPMLDTRTGDGFLGEFISSLFLSVISFVAQMERENIRARQAQGIAAAKARGVRFGRMPRPAPAPVMALCPLWWEGLITCQEASDKSGCPYKTVWRHFQEWKRKKCAEPLC